MNAKISFSVYHLDETEEEKMDFFGEVYAENAGKLADIIRAGKFVEVKEIQGNDADLIGLPWCIDSDSPAIFDEIEKEARAFDSLSDGGKNDVRNHVRECDEILYDALNAMGAM